MAGAAAMVAEARKHLGLGEPNFIQAWYRKRNGAAFSGNWSWCDAFVTYCAVQSGNYQAVCHGRDYALTTAHARRFQAAGEWHAGTRSNVNRCQPGDVVFFDWGGSDSVDNIDHVGIVEKPLGGGNVQTIEGNTSDRCLRRERSYAVIAGYGRPKYAGAAGTPPSPGTAAGRPLYVSLGMRNPQHVTAGRSVNAVFDKEYSDDAKLHADGAHPGILTGGAHGASFVLEVDLGGFAGSWRLVETDPRKAYAVSKTYPLHWADGSVTTAVHAGLCDAGQHLYVELHPAADGDARGAVKAHVWRR